MKNYLCKNCKYNNNGWCNKRSFNGLKNIVECEYYKIDDYTGKYNCTESIPSNTHAPLTISTQKKYCVDFNKVEDFNDLKNVVQILFAGLPVVINEDCGFLDEIKEYLIEIK